MSQYPPPYPPPPMYSMPAPGFSYFTPQRDLLAPARRAAVLQAVLGGFMLLCGACVGGFPWMVNVEQLIAQSGMTLPQLPSGTSLEQMFRIVYTTMGVVAGLVGIGLLTLSAFVRNGGRGAVIASILLQGFVVLVLAINLVGGLVQLGRNPVAGVIGLLMIAVPLALFGLNIAWLAVAARHASHVAAAREQYQAQYLYYQQQHQTYGYAGGYGTPYPATGYGNPAPATGAAPAPTTPPNPTEPGRTSDMPPGQ